MESNETSQAQQQNPFTSVFTQLPGLEMWKTMLQQQNERFEQAIGELERLEKERHERAMHAIDDVTRLVKSSIDYQSKLNAQWRELSVEATRKGLEMMSPSAES